MGKAVFANDETYDLLVKKARLVGVPIAHILKSIVNTEEQKLEKEQPKQEQPKQEQFKKEDQPVFIAIPPKNKENKEKNLIKEIEKMEINEEKMQKMIANGIQESKLQDKKEAKQEKSLDDLKNSVQRLEKKFCADGVCFLTRPELDNFLASQQEGRAKFEEKISQKLTEIAKMNTGKQSPSQSVLPLINKQIRGTLTEAQQTERDIQVKKVLNQANITANDTFRLLKADPQDYEGIKKKVFEGVSPEELMNKCNLGDKSACEKLYKASKLVVLKEDKKSKKWEAIYNPEAEEQKPELGLFGLPRKC